MDRFYFYYFSFHFIGKESALWYPWGPSTSQCKLFLCKECWLYWKKYGGLKKTAKTTNPSPLAETVYKCRICNKKFNRAERLSNHMAAHKGLKCSVPGCEKVLFSLMWPSILVLYSQKTYIQMSINKCIIYQ